MDRASPVPGQPGPPDLPAWTLVQAGHAVGRRFHETFASVGLTAHRFGVLVRLTLEPGASQAALAREVLVTPQSMGPILEGMEADGLVRRTAPAARGSAIGVTITAAGRRALRRAYPLVAGINAPDAMGLTERESVTLNRLLHRVLAHAHADASRRGAG